MKHTTFNVSFYCRDSKANTKGLAPVEMSIIINGQRTLVTLPRKEKPSEFRKALASKRNNGIRDYTDAVRARLNDITTEMMEQGLQLTATTLKEFFHNGGVRPYTIENLFNDYIAIVEKKAGTGEITQKTYRKYLLARERFFGIIDKEKPVTAITSTVIADYMASLRKDYNTVTANGYGQKVKTIVKYGMSKGLVKIDPFVGIHIRKGDMDVEFLTEEELSRIRDTDFQNRSLNRVRDLFVFQASSGMSYCDMAAIVPSDIQFNDVGQAYIHKRRAKTKVYFTSVILPDGMVILDRYDYHLPTISNNKYNAYLKPIRDLCGIDKPLHTHIARHTYATRCINAGIRLEVVAKLLGHTTTRITQHYAKLLQSSIIDEVRDAFKIANTNL